MKALQPIEICPHCRQSLPVFKGSVNFVICPSCNNAVFQEQNNTQPFTDYDITNKIRLDKVLKQLQTEPKSNNLLPEGIIEIEYAEASMYGLFTGQRDFSFLLFHEYQWYRATPSTFPIQTTDSNQIIAGEECNIFDEPSYVINRETNNKFSFSGGLYFPYHEKKRLLVEHVYRSTLYFSIWLGDQYEMSFELTETDPPNLDLSFIHYKQSIKCKSCKSLIEVPGFPFTRSAACSCGTCYSISAFGDVKKECSKQTYQVPYLPLQAKAVFEDTSYEIIGHCTKQDQDLFRWEEYTLWNDVKGFLYLSAYKGHWLKLNQVKLKNYVATSQKLLASQVVEGHQTFQLFNDYRSGIIHARGLFAGNVFNEASYEGIEYIAPPSVWTFEKPENESVSAFRGDHLSAEALTQAIQEPIKLPREIGIGMAQPFRGSIGVKRMYANYVLGGLFLLLCQFLSNLNATDEEIFSTSGSVFVEPTPITVTSPVFELKKNRSNLCIELNADVLNSWFEMEAELTNIDEGKSYSTEIGVEYYQGYEDGEAWSEGEKESSFTFSALPKGRYQLTLTPAFNTASPPTTYTVKALNNVTMYHNLWLILLLIGIPALVFSIFNYNREYSRWSNSNYSPFNTGEE